MTKSIKNILKNPLLYGITLALTGCSKKAIQLGVGDSKQQEDLHPSTSRKRCHSEDQKDQNDCMVKRWIEDCIDKHEAKLQCGILDLNLPDFLDEAATKELVTGFFKKRDTVIHTVNLSWASKSASPNPSQFLGVLSALEGTSVRKLNLGEIEELNFHGYNLGSNGSRFYAILSALEGTSVRKLNLCDNQLDQLDPKELYKAFSSLKKTKIEELDLACNDLGFNKSGFHIILSALEETSVRKLDLGENQLKKLSPQELYKAFSSLKKTKIEELNIEHNDYSNNSDSDNSDSDNSDSEDSDSENSDNALIFYNQVFTALKDTPVRKLSLGLAAPLENFRPQEAEEVFTLLQGTNIEHLRIQNLNLSHIEPSFYNKVFSALEGGGIRRLDVELGPFWRLSSEELSEAFSSLQKTNVEELQLQHYDPSNTGTKFYRALSVLEKTSVRTLYLSEPRLHYLKTEALRSSLLALKNTKVDTVQLHHVTPKNCPDRLIDEFNTKIAYPHEAIYRRNGLQRVSIRAIRKAMPDLDRVEELLSIPPKLRKEIKTYNVPGLHIIYDSDSELNTSFRPIGDPESEYDDLDSEYDDLDLE